MEVLSSIRRKTGRGLENPTHSIRIYRRHAARAMREERWCVAEIFINRIIDMAPAHTEAWLTKGWIRQHCRGDEATALECYQRVIHLCSDDGLHPHVQRAKKAMQKIVAAAV